jgi:photosystem II stability/assembly factor-like uncharacterized protein
VQIKKASKLLFFLLTIFLLTIPCHAQQYWLQQQCPTTKSLLHLAFTDTLNGWAAGDSGVIVHTSNGGAGWIEQQSLINSSVEDVFFVNSRLGWALSNDFYYTGTIILRTTNGGINWTNSRYPDTTVYFRSIYFIDSSKGFLGGISYNGTVIYYTTNGGNGWVTSSIVISNCFNFPVLRFNFLNSLTGYACGGVNDQGGIYLKTTDGGLHWIDSCIAAEPVYDILPLTGLKVLATGGDPEYGSYIYATSDGGVSWSNQSLEAGISQRIARRTFNEFWIPCGYTGKFAVSTDTASNWFGIDLQDSIKAFDTRFVTPFSGWSVGNKGSNSTGVILKYNPALIGIQSQNAPAWDAPFLFQNYPNPFNPATLIKFYLPRRDLVQITIYDILGRIIKVFDEAVLSAGEHSIEFDAHEFASGIYIYSLKSFNEEKESIIYKKMVLIK